jgi:hypothetical protein
LQGEKSEAAMGKDTNTEKLLQLSGVIVRAGLALIFLQLAAQIVLSFGWLTNNAGGDLGSFYIGVPVLLSGAVLMGLLSVSSRVQNKPESIFDSSDSNTLKNYPKRLTANVTGRARKGASADAAAGAANNAIKDARKDAANDAARDDTAAASTLL